MISMPDYSHGRQRFCWGLLHRFAKNIIQKMLCLCGTRYNYFLIKGLLSPANRVSHHDFMHGLWSVSTDFVRNATLFLLSKEIDEQEIKGEVAEVGVFQGDFAALINRCFPGRVLYLFDTFEGFADNDTTFDIAGGLSENHHDFSRTNIELVLSKMDHTDNVRIQKGWFPASALGCENEVFCFVSLDTDLYKPIYEGLVWFYPRLAEGGYIMVHDYNSATYRGVKKAVRQFAQEQGVPYTVLPDTGGSIIIGKPRRHRTDAPGS